VRPSISEASQLGIEVKVLLHSQQVEKNVFLRAIPQLLGDLRIIPVSIKTEELYAATTLTNLFGQDLETRGFTSSILTEK